MKTIPIGVGAALILAASFGPLAAQEPTPARFANPDHILAEADSFAFQANGQRFGLQVVSVTRTDDGFRFEETSTMPQATQTSEVLLTPELAMRSVTQRGTAMGSEMRIDVEYAPGRATGSALTPASGGQAVAIDAEVAEGIVDDNVLVALLPAIEWTGSSDVLVPVFHSGQNSSARVRLRVTGTETVEVPAGTFETLRIESSGDSTPLVFFVEAAAPHRVVRMEIAGTPLEIVRLN